MNTQELHHQGHGPIQIGDAIKLSLKHDEGHDDGSHAIPFGFPSLDRLTGGWKERELIVIGARPAVGKTVFALNVARNAAVEHDIPTAYYSTEVPVSELTYKLIASETGVTPERLQDDVILDNGNWRQLEPFLVRLSRAPLYIDDTPSLRIRALEERIRSNVLAYRVRLVVIDHLQQLLPDDDTAFDSKRKETEDYLRRIKELAVELGIAVILLTNIRRPTRKNYSGPITRDLDAYCPPAEDYADKIILLHRPSFLGHEIDGGKTDLLQLLLVKNGNGAVGNVNLVYKSKGVRLSELRRLST